MMFHDRLESHGHLTGFIRTLAKDHACFIQILDSKINQSMLRGATQINSECSPVFDLCERHWRITTAWKNCTVCGRYKTVFSQILPYSDNDGYIMA